MAADVTLDSEPPKSCCSEWKEKYLKLEEKRNALRQAVKLLENEVNKLQAQNLELRRVCEQEKKKADCESKEKEKESHIRNELEKEMHSLKAEIASLQNKGCPADQDEDGGGLLLSRVLEGEAEINRLKELLEKERKRCGVERKKADFEKVKAAEAWKLVEVEKKKSENEKKLADIERKRAEECKLCLESLKVEANEIRSKWLAEKSKVEEANRKAEAERQKAIREKKRVESYKVKVLEQKKCTEAERQKAMNEKSHADHLSQQWEEERRKNEVLKKEIEKAISFGGNKKCHLSLPIDNVRAGVFNEKVFKDKLKMEMEKTKHAKRMAKLEKVRNSLLLKELYLLKHYAMHFSHRFDILDSCFSHGMEGIDGLAKIGNSPKVQRNNSSHRVPATQGHDLHFQIENEITRTCCTRNAVGHHGSSLECTGMLFGGGCAQPISGISSELESVVGGSVRNESQNSALYSTSTSFSDRQLIGSQGRGVLPTAASANPEEENLREVPSVRTFSCEGTEKGYCKNLAVSAKKNVWNVLDKPLRTSGLDSTLIDQYEVLDKPPGHRRKKKRIQDASEAVAFDGRKRKKIHDAMESVASFNSNSEKLDLGMNRTYLLDVLGPESDLHGSVRSRGGGHSESLPLDGKLIKLRRMDMKQLPVIQPCDSDKLELKDHSQFECSSDFMFPSANLGCDAGHACRINTVTGRRNQHATLCVDEIISGDYMRLLELDDAEEEERFRIAMKMPLSPTLPEIESPNLGDFEANNPGNLFENGTYTELMISKDNFEVASMNCLGFGEKTAVPMLGHGASACSEDTSGAPSSLEIVVEYRGVITPAELGQDSISCALASDTRSEVLLQMPIPNIQQLEVSCTSMPKYFVVFSNIKDEHKIFRIFAAAKNCISRSSMVSQTSCVVSKILHELSLEHDLLSEEKVSAFFSMLLYNFTVTANTRRVKSGDHALFSDFLKAQMNKEAKHLLVESCQCDLLFSLIEEFLIAGRLWVYNDVDGKALSPVGSGSEVSFSYGGSLFISKTATVDQLEAGGVILASICSALDCVDFICEASYSILQMCKCGSSWILRVLHVFASICGEEYLHHSKYGLVMTSIKSIVLFLEGGIKVAGSESSSCYHPESDIRPPGFSPCVQCPFTDGALGLEKVMLLLMDMLDDCAISEATHQNPMKSIISLVPMVSAQTEGAERMVEYRNNIEGINVGDEVSPCSCDDRETVTKEVSCWAEPVLYQTTDSFSLVELLSCYLSWDWVYSNVIPCLLKLLDAQVHKEFLAAVLLLIGQLGRHGIEAGRCLPELKELRYSLSAFLDVNAARERGFPFQLAAIHALIDLGTFDFEEFIQKNSQISVETTSSSSHAEAVKKWFSQLSKVQQDLALKYFQSNNATKTDDVV